MPPAYRPRVAACLSVLLLASGCAAADDGGPTEVLTSTDVIGDLVANVGGDLVEVSSIVPAGGDPHSYEPSPRDTEKVVSADVVFTNGMLLEEHSITKLVDSNARADAASVALAEQAETYGAKLIPLEEDLGLDVLWLGLAVQGGDESDEGEVELRVTDMDGPGRMAVYLTDSLGEPEIYFDSADGFDDADVVELPMNAHTHVNWAFTAPGVYRVTMAADRVGAAEASPRGESTFTFAVGDETEADGLPLDIGHADITADLDVGEPIVRTDAHGELAAADVTLVVPDKAKESIPDSQLYEFLGEPGDAVWLLPQAVLGKHVHGEIDPHLWLDVEHAESYVRIIEDTLGGADPDNAATYAANARAYLKELDELDGYVSETIATIPDDRRRLVTTHDAFGYLAQAYAMEVVGFVVPNPAAEPSAKAVSRLTATITDLDIPAVFVEPNLATRAEVLRQVAEDVGAQVCVLNGDVLSKDSPTYLDFMRHNADELARCLG